MCTLNTGHVLILISLTDILHSIFEENVSHLWILSVFSQDHFKKSSWKSRAHTSYHTVNHEVNELSSNIIIKGKDGPAHTMKSHRGTRGVAPFILNPSAR